MDAQRLTDDLGTALERARGALDHDIAVARKAVKAAQAELSAVLAHVSKASSLVGLNSEIATARKELDKLKVEIAKINIDLQRLAKERTEAEAKVLALGNEAKRWLEVRSQSEAAVRDVKTLFAQIQLGQQQ